jgi:hypothetical protein
MTRSEHRHGLGRGAGAEASMSTSPLLKNKLGQRQKWRRILQERLTEPVHLNLLSLFVLLFGSYRAKIAWDLVIRQQYAYGILRAADLAREQGREAVTVVEVGVASGAGVMNMAMIAEKVSELTGVTITVHGFDTGAGMPAPVDYRDHPDLYAEGDFPMDFDSLRANLPPRVTLHIGPLESTVPAFLESVDASGPVGFVAFDVDYYSSTTQALKLLAGPAELYLPITMTYLDDIALDPHNRAAGVFLAVDEFNRSSEKRQLEHHPFFERSRIFTRTIWVKQLYFLHVLDHPRRSRPDAPAEQRYIANPYLPGAPCRRGAGCVNQRRSQTR